MSMMSTWISYDFRDIGRNFELTGNLSYETFEGFPILHIDFV
jgi:hypothetical protein